MVLVFLADGFETIEALTPVDILRRGGVEVKTVSVSKNPEVISAQKIPVKADVVAGELRSFEDNLFSLEGIILPGGMPGAKNLDESPVVDEYINRAYEHNKKGGNILLCAICAAPFIYGKRGMLEGKAAVCYPGFEKFLIGAKIKNKPVTHDGFMICSKAMGCAHDFGLEILAALRGKEKSEEVGKSIYYA